MRFLPVFASLLAAVHALPQKIDLEAVADADPVSSVSVPIGAAQATTIQYDPQTAYVKHFLEYGEQLKLTWTNPSDTKQSLSLLTRTHQHRLPHRLELASKSVQPATLSQLEPDPFPALILSALSWPIRLTPPLLQLPRLRLAT